MRGPGMKGEADGAGRDVTGTGVRAAGGPPAKVAAPGGGPKAQAPRPPP